MRLPNLLMWLGWLFSLFVTYGWGFRRGETKQDRDQARRIEARTAKFIERRK